jgi:hypothetical protein
MQFQMPLTRKLVPERLDSSDIAFSGLGEHSWACRGAIPPGYLLYAVDHWMFVFLFRLMLCLIVQVEEAQRNRLYFASPLRQSSIQLK